MNRNTILLVDDMSINRAILRSLFEADYNILEAENGERALMMIRQYKDSLAVVLLDIVMPVMDGYHVLASMQAEQLLSTVPVIIITAQDASESEVRAFDLGASDIIKKPFEPYVIRRRVQNVVDLSRHKRHLEDLVEEQAVDLRQSKEVLMDTLSSVIEHRSIESGQHVLRIRMFTKVLLENVATCYPEYGLNEHKIAVISSAAAMHDIGKIAIPDAILKKPDKLTPEEFEVMKTHTIKGCEILERLSRMPDKEYLHDVYQICRHHHERWDGKGYPDGLKGENIPLSAQVVGIADAYDALTTDRVYKKAYTPERAYNMILNNECGLFSPRLLECFKNVRLKFAKLTYAYADGIQPLTQTHEDLNIDAHAAPVSTLELSQMKYFSLLRYVDATTIEVDLETGIYHIVYRRANSFDMFHMADTFEQSFKTFAKSHLHPDDLDKLPDYKTLRDFLTSGALKKVFCYRVHHPSFSGFIPCRATALRVDIDDSHSSKVLIIFSVADMAALAPHMLDQDVTIMENAMVGVQLCRMDASFTLLHVNNGFISMFGYTRSELKDQFQNRFIDLIHPDDRKAVMQQVSQNASHSNSFELQYRALTKNGNSIWVLDKCQVFMRSDGNEYCSCMLIDITKTKQDQEALRLSIERHQIIMRQTNDIIIEWDMVNDKLTYASNWKKLFNDVVMPDNLGIDIFKFSRMHPDDIPGFIKILRNMGTGVPYGEMEIRIANAQGSYTWCRMRATTQFNSESKPIKGVGVISDIDVEKRRTQELIDRADHDSLTQLYNKNAAQRRIEQLMAQVPPDGVSALMVLDLDNFKTINDTRGHMFGDAVLVEVAAVLRKLFTANDIAARIGGDEFMVYLHTVTSKEQLSAHANRLVTSIEHILQDELKSNPMACSLGVACYRENANNFQELFQCCDRALYTAKYSGKNQYVFYDAQIGMNFMLNPQQTTVTTRIDSEQTYNDDTINIIGQAFRLMYQKGDTTRAIMTILEFMGRRYQVSRSYIFEVSADGQTATNTFEWCAEGIEPQIQLLQCVDMNSLGNYWQNFDENGIFYCTDLSLLPQAQQELLAMQNIDSMLQCAVYDDGRLAGFVGFDSCGNKRQWTQPQINALNFVSEFLSIFLLKKRAQDKLLGVMNDLNMLLNTLNSYIYVIDPESYELFYINDKTMLIAPTAKLGMTCHKAFFNLDSPCVHCPAKSIRQTHSNTLEVFNSRLNVWTQATAALMHWNDATACLLCCNDISIYKNQIISLQDRLDEQEKQD